MTLSAHHPSFPPRPSRIASSPSLYWPTWRLFGVITDASTGQPIPFARVSDDPQGQPPHFQTIADHLGHFELLTIAEKHSVIVSALGYRPARAGIGRKWFLWMPSGDQRLDVTLLRE